MNPHTSTDAEGHISVPAEKALPPKRVIEGYEEKLCIPFGGRETVLAENQEKEQSYLVCSIKWDNPLGMEERYDGVVTDDYVEAMREFVGRVDKLGLEIETAREAAGLPLQPLGSGYCLPDIQNADWKGHVVIISPEHIAPEYRSAEHQLILCTGGYGANHAARGQAVFAQELFSGKKMRYERFQVAGIADPARMPEWAITKLAELTGQQERDAMKSSDKKPSLLGKLDENKEKVVRDKEKNKGKSAHKKHRDTEVRD
jgi:hypothetical protein